MMMGAISKYRSRISKLDLESGRELTQNPRYIRSHMDLDDLERMARFPPVDEFGRVTKTVTVDQAGSHGQ